VNLSGNFKSFKMFGTIPYTVHLVFTPTNMALLLWIPTEKLIKQSDKCRDNKTPVGYSGPN